MKRLYKYAIRHLEHQLAEAVEAITVLEKVREQLAKRLEESSAIIESMKQSNQSLRETSTMTGEKGLDMAQARQVWKDRLSAQYKAALKEEEEEYLNLFYEEKDGFEEG